MSSASSLLTSVDPTTTKSPYDHITDQQINEAITKLNLTVAGWNPEKPQPDWMDAFWVIPNWIMLSSKVLFFQLRWQLQYNLLKQELSESDRHHLCRTHFRLSESKWNSLNDDEKESYLSKPGKWKSKKTPQPDKKEKET